MTPSELRALVEQNPGYGAKKGSTYSLIRAAIGSYRIAKFKYRGVTKTSDNRFRADIRTDSNENLFLGFFDSATEAAEAYNRLARALYGPYCYQNNILGMFTN